MKRILTFSILLAVSALSAFELGKPCTIYFAPRCRAAAEDLAAIMSKVYSQNFPVKAAGKLRTEGKTYIMQDGDVVEFKFNV